MAGSDIPESSRTAEYSTMERRGAPYRNILVLQWDDASTGLHRTPLGSGNSSTVAVLGLGAALPSPSAPAVLQRRAVAFRIRAASSSQPGRSAWRAGSRASRGKRLRAARRRTPRLAPPSGSSLEHALNERGCEPSSTDTFRSQECSCECSQKNIAEKYPAVIAGLDPAIHPLRKMSLRRRWTRGSSPRVTGRGLRPTLFRHCRA